MTDVVGMRVISAYSYRNVTLTISPSQGSFGEKVDAFFLCVGCGLPRGFFGTGLNINGTGKRVCGRESVEGEWEVQSRADGGRDCPVPLGPRERRCEGVSTMER